MPNPITGPIFINGINAGDMVGIEILAIDVESEGIGIYSGKYRKISIENGFAIFSDKLSIPLNPHIGVIGLAPSEGSISSRVPGEHGGNLDTKEICAGSMIIIPACEEGGGLALGDVHAVMADGETSGSGLEIGAIVTLRVTKVSFPYQRHLYVLTDNDLIILGSAPTLEEASKIAISRVNLILKKYLHLEQSEAELLNGLCCHLRISQIVNPLQTAKVLIPISLLNMAIPIV